MGDDDLMLPVITTKPCHKVEFLTADNVQSDAATLGSLQHGGCQFSLATALVNIPTPTSVSTLMTVENIVFLPAKQPCRETTTKCRSDHVLVKGYDPLLIMVI